MARLDKETLGKRIRRFRTARGLTQAQLGEIYNASQTVISDMETGKYDLSVFDAERLADALGVSVVALLPEWFDDHQITEAQIVALYRRLPPAGRAVAVDLLDALVARAEAGRGVSTSTPDPESRPVEQTGDNK